MPRQESSSRWEQGAHERQRGAPPTRRRGARRLRYALRTANPPGTAPPEGRMASNLALPRRQADGQGGRRPRAAGEGLLPAPRACRRQRESRGWWVRPALQKRCTAAPVLKHVARGQETRTSTVKRAGAPAQAPARAGRLGESKREGASGGQTPERADKEKHMHRGQPKGAVTGHGRAAAAGAGASGLHASASSAPGTGAGERANSRRSRGPAACGALPRAAPAPPPARRRRSAAPPARARRGAAARRAPAGPPPPPPLSPASRRRRRRPPPPPRAPRPPP
jgi:hypothetical protein